VSAPHVLVIDLAAPTPVEVGLAAHAILAAERDSTFGQITRQADGTYTGYVLVRSDDFGALAQRLDAMALPAIVDWYAEAEL
jgi:hypothetical protein